MIPAGTRRPRALLGGAVLGVGAALTLLARVGAALNPITCPLRAATGLDCPLCGGTRAAVALLRGQAVTALDQNALVTLALVAVVVLGLRWCRCRWRTPAGQGTPTRRPWAASPRLLAALGVLALAFTVLRNLPGVPFLHSGLS